MTLFFVAAALLVVISLAWLLVGLFRPEIASIDQEAVNITLARERRQTLEIALADGSIDQATYDYERQQLEYDLAADLQLESEKKPVKSGHIPAAILVAVFIPVTAGALYLHLGNPSAITQPRELAQGAPAQGGPDAPSLATLLPQLEERLAASPDDIEGWRLLGRSYLSVSDFAGAKNAFETALALDGSDVPTLAQLAESIAMTQGGDLAGEPLSLLQRANAMDANHEHTMWLLAIARQQSGDHEGALAGFNRLLNMAGDNLEASSTIEQMRRRSLEALALGESQTSNTAATAQLPEPQTDTGKTSIDVTVTASDATLQASQPDQVIFIYATASNGPPMPLAVKRLSVADLPVTVTLDDSMAMVPTMTLSTFPEVTIGARVSTSGTAAAQPGDWFDERENVVLGNTPAIALTIDKQVTE